MNGLVDTHVHLDFPDYQDDFSEVLKRAEENHIVGMISIGINVASSQKAISLAENYDQIWASVGVHPHDVKQLKGNYKEKLKQLANSPRVVAIGETGLDYYRMRSPKQKQQEAFRQQIKLARELELPLVIHCRDAYEDTYRIMEEEKAQEVGGVLHCFSGDVALALKALNKGYFISFAGPVTYPKSHRVKKVVEEVPLDRILLETDAPFLSPQKYRGKRNEPAYIKETYAEVANIKGVLHEELEESCLINVKRLFNFSP